MTNYEKKQKVRDYNRRYYLEKRKLKNQDQEVQPTIFDGLQIQEIQETLNLETQKPLIESRPLELETPFQEKIKRKISINRGGEQRPLEIETKNLELETVFKVQDSRSLNLEKPLLESRPLETLNLNHSSCTVAPTLLDETADQFLKAVQTIASKKLFPDAQKKVNFWVIFELLALIVISCFVLAITIKTLKNVAEEIFWLVIAVETVSIFFSFSLQKSRGLSLFLKVLVLASCVAVTNYLIISNVVLQAQHEKQRVLQVQEQVASIKADIAQTRATISDLQARGRITASAQHTGRLDLLTQKLELLQKSSGQHSDKMTMLQIVMRIILSLSIFIFNHQIAEIFSSRRFFKFDLGNKGTI